MIGGTLSHYRIVEKLGARGGVRELQRTRDHDAVTDAEGRSYRC
jgi:hypothetical protein